jgi:hypothetical protein
VKVGVLVKVLVNVGVGVIVKVAVAVEIFVAVDVNTAVAVFVAVGVSVLNHPPRLLSTAMKAMAASRARARRMKRMFFGFMCIFFLRYSVGINPRLSS